MIDSFLEEYPLIQAPVVLQRLRERGFDGQITIVRDYLRKRREKALKSRQVFIRFESAPGVQMQIDWGTSIRSPMGRRNESSTPWRW